MPEITEAQQKWVKDVLGLDSSGATAAASEKRSKSGADGDDEAKRNKGFFDAIADGLKSAGDSIRSAAETVTTTLGITSAIADGKLTAALKALADEADALLKLGFDAKQMMADHADMSKQGASAERLTDQAAKTKALDALVKRTNEMVEHAKALSATTKTLMGDKKGSPDAATKSAIYKQTLKDLYGLSIQVPTGMSNTHLDKMFDMLGSVPKDDVKQEKFKTLTYSNAKDDKNSGAYYQGGNKIEMGNFGDATGTEEYEIDGEKIPANSFNVTALHEVGHAVDDKHGIMTANGSKTGCGGWKPETIASTAAALLPDLKSSLPQGSKATDKSLTKVMEIALDSGSTTQPKDIDDTDWAEIVKFLVAKCLFIRAKNNPWFKNTQVVVDGRAYQQAYPNEWWSYENGSRTSTKVNAYQWRSPAEWFAEVYAISWLSKKKPPAGVDASVQPYMYQA
jgi:hypothetical protein